MGIPKWLRGKESACNAGDVSSTPGSGKPLRGGNGNPLQYSCLENPMDRGAWWATVHGVTTSRTGLNDWPSPCILKMILEHVTHFRESNELSCIFCVFSLERAFLHFWYFSVRTGNFQRLGTMCSARRGYKQVPGDVGSHFL